MWALNRHERSSPRGRCSSSYHPAGYRPCRLRGLSESLHTRDIAAANALLDRGYGKPLQTVEANNTSVNYAVSDKPMSDEEWTETFVTEH
jgi:hypothetical protein